MLPRMFDCNRFRRWSCCFVCLLRVSGSLLKAKMAEGYTYISFQRPRDVTASQLLEWEIQAARTVHQYALEDATQAELLGEATAAQIVNLIASSESGAVCDMVTQALTLLISKPEGCKVLVEAGALAALIRIIGTRLKAEDPSVQLQLTCLAQAVATDQLLIPKVAHGAMRETVEALRSTVTRVRTAGARLALNLFQGKEPVWDMFIRREGVQALGGLFRLADEQESLMALRIIETFCDKPRYMFHVRPPLMDAVTLLSRSPNAEIAASATHILEASRYNQTWKGISTMDPYARAMVGKAQGIVEKDAYTNSLADHAPKAIDRSGPATLAEAGKDSKGYPYLSEYPHEKKEEATA